MAPRNSISDDWEDVGDDNLSVISLSGSESDLPSPKRTPNKDRSGSALKVASPTKASNPGTSQSLPPTKQEVESTPVQRDISPKSKELETSVGEELGNPESPVSGIWHDARGLPSLALEDPFKDPDTDGVGNEADDEESDAVREVIDDASDGVDPIFLDNTLESLIKILRQTIGFISGLETAFVRQTGPSITACREIQSQVQRLRPMISAYAKVSDYSDLPIDPALHGWLEGVRVKVLALRAQHSSVRTSSADFANIWNELDAYKNQMDEFLPIMLAYEPPHLPKTQLTRRSDYNEYQTKNLPVARPFKPTKPINIPTHSYPSRSHPRYATGEDNSQAVGNPLHNDNVNIWDLPAVAYQPPRNTAVPVPGTNPDGPSNSTWLLRRDLYHLKDLLQRAQERLTASVSKLDAALAEWAVTAAIRYMKLSQAVGTAVSNHASDWYAIFLNSENNPDRRRIESTSSGGMTYPEFLSLDRDLIGIYSAQLEEVVGKLSETDTYVSAGFGMRGQTLYPSYQQLVNADELEVLERIGDFLAAMFRLNED